MPFPRYLRRDMRESMNIEQFFFRRDVVRAAVSTTLPDSNRYCGKKQAGRVTVRTGVCSSRSTCCEAYLHERACIQFFCIFTGIRKKKAHDACFSVITSSEIICSVIDRSEFRSRVSFRVGASLMEAPNDCLGKLSFDTAVTTKAEIKYTWSYHEMWRIDIFNYFEMGVWGLWDDSTCMPASPEWFWIIYSNIGVELSIHTPTQRKISKSRQILLRSQVEPSMRHASTACFDNEEHFCGFFLLFSSASRHKQINFMFRGLEAAACLINL